MRLISFIKKKIILLLSLLFVLPCANAQDAAATEKIVTSDNNLLAILLVVMTLILAFVIWGLGRVLVVLSTQMIEKDKQQSKILSIVALTLFMLASQSAMAQNINAVKVLPNYGGLSSTTFYMFVTVIAIEVAAVLFLTFSIQRIYKELIPQKETALAKTSPIKEWWARMDKKLFTRAVPVEKEADVLLDHDYDGIKELDNALPPWWKYGFYITIVAAFIYLFNFHLFGSGKNPTEEYAAEMKQAKIELAAFEAQNKDRIDESNVPMADATEISAAKKMYEEKCSACHGKLGEGLAGPNLTDDYWLHKGSLNDVYSSIKNGYADKGMQAWSTTYTPKEMSYLASYVKILKGTNPQNGKPAQGELFTEIATGSDSTGTVKLTDTVTTK